MARIGNRPFLELLLNQLRRHGCQRVILAVGYRQSRLRMAARTAEMSVLPKTARSPASMKSRLFGHGILKCRSLSFVDPMLYDIPTERQVSLEDRG
jgi:NDP-sugar pyrophosphorylase family protein